MISGDNSNFTEEYESQDNSYSADSTSAVIAALKERRNNVICGGVNCIPFPFKHFRTEIPGIEKNQYVVVTASQKTGKTQLTDFRYVFHALDYVYDNRDKCSIHIIYFALEESVERIMERYMSYLLYKLDGLRLAPIDLRSTSKDFPVPQEALDLLESEPYQDRLKFFEECVQFETEDTNPTGILRVCEAYAKSVGDYKTKKIKAANGKDMEIFDSYTQHDKNHYMVVIVDHIGLVDKEQGFRTKDAVDKMSEYFVKYLRNRYGFTCVAIQQQASESEGLEAIKQKRMTPTAATLGDSKYTARDADIVLGLFDPSKFGKADYLGYKINALDGSGLKSYCRFINVIANRHGEMGGVCALFFDGAVCNFEELPRPDEISALDQYYNKVKNIKSYRQQKKLKALNAIFSLFKRKKVHLCQKK